MIRNGSFRGILVTGGMLHDCEITIVCLDDTFEIRLSSDNFRKTVVFDNFTELFNFTQKYIIFY